MSALAQAEVAAPPQPAALLLTAHLAAGAGFSAGVPHRRLLAPVASESFAGIVDVGVGAARSGWRRQ